MTTLKKLVSEIDFNNERMETNPSWERLADELRVDGLYWSEDKRLRCYFIKIHCCTDTYVGTRAYFLDGELVCVSTQSARKSDEFFSFVTKEIGLKVRDYLLTLVEDDEFTIDVIGDFEMELPETYKIEYNTQIMHKTALLNGERVEIIKKYFEKEGIHSVNYFHNVHVKAENGITFTVDCRDLDFEYNTIN